MKRRALAAVAQRLLSPLPSVGHHELPDHGWTLERAAAIAGHASARTTQLCNRLNDEITLDEIERIRI